MNSSGGSHAVQHRHTQVHQYDLRFEALNTLQGFLTVGGLTDNFDSISYRQQRAKSLTEQRLIVHQEDSNSLHPGTSTSKMNPFPGAVRTRTSPLRSWARSRSPSKPNPPVE